MTELLAEMLMVLLFTNIVLLVIGMIADHRLGVKTDWLSAKIDSLEDSVNELTRGPRQTNGTPKKENRTMFSEPRFQSEQGGEPGPRDYF